MVTMAADKEQLMEEIKVQGQIVRTLKEQGAEKDKVSLRALIFPYRALKIIYL